MDEEEVHESFERSIMPNILAVEKVQGGAPDYPMRCETFALYVDALHRDGDIDDEVAFSVTQPENVKGPK